MITEIQTQKQEGWRETLSVLTHMNADRPFQWGVNDCVTSASDSVIVITGKDPFQWGRGKYTNKHEAVAVLRGHFGVGLLNTFTRIFHEMGFAETDAMRCGDIGFVRIINCDPDAAQMFGGITMVTGVNDQGGVIAPGEKELMLINKYELVRAWKL